MPTASTPRGSWQFWSITLLASAGLAGCGGGGDAPTQAQLSDITVGTPTPGTSAFNASVTLQGTSVSGLASVAYVIAAKPGSVSKPVHVTYSMAALQRRGDATVGSGTLTLPLFGLYDASTNPVSISLTYSDQSVQQLLVNVTTVAWVDPLAVYQHPMVNVSRAAGSTLGYDFFAIKPSGGPLVVVDTDGAVRWAGPPNLGAMATAYEAGGFVIGSPDSSAYTRVEWDGTTTSGALPSTYAYFRHNIDPGKAGLLGDLDTAVNVESTLVEFDPGSSKVTQSWDMAALISAYMTSQGDDASAFVRPGSDWFHLNSSTYDPSDDTVILSSRENFVIKVDYSTGRIIWILGDPTKYWTTFPSLRAKALTLIGGGLVPIGQHAVSITTDGRLMLFNDGTASLSQPAGAPAGSSRSYSAVSVYTIDPVAMTAQESWDFSYGQSTYSAICSSAYQAGDGSVLIDYADVEGGAAARVVGLDPTGQVVFDFRYASSSACASAWNSIPVPLDALTFN